MGRGGVVPVDARHPDPAVLDRAGRALEAGDVVAFPTDTLYGLAVDPRSPVAARRLFALKGRAAQVAAPLIAADTVQADLAVRMWTPLARRLAARFWPGPLSLVLEAAPSLDTAVLGGGTTVAIRVPAHPLARALAATFTHPVTATSANRSGTPAAADAAAVVAALGDGVALVLDAGPTAAGPPSTIADARGEQPRLLREGAIAWDRVLAACGEGFTTGC